jgi:hypothetical protein
MAVRSDHHNLTGRWQIDPSQSNLAPMPLELTVTINHEGAALHVDMIGVRNDGSLLLQRFETLTDGSDATSFLNGAQVTCRSYWAGVELVIESVFDAPDGPTTFRDYWSMDPRHDLLIMEHRDDPLSGNRSVFTRRSKLPTDEDIGTTEV